MVSLGLKRGRVIDCYSYNKYMSCISCDTVVLTKLGRTTKRVKLLKVMKITLVKSVFLV